MNKKTVISHAVALFLGLLGGLLGRDLGGLQKPAEKAVEAVVTKPAAVVDAGTPTIVNIPPPLGQ